VKWIEEIMIISREISIENTIALSDRSLESENLFHNDIPCVVVHSV